MKSLAKPVAATATKQLSLPLAVPAKPVLKSLLKPPSPPAIKSLVNEAPPRDPATVVPPQQPLEDCDGEGCYTALLQGTMQLDDFRRNELIAIAMHLGSTRDDCKGKTVKAMREIVNVHMAGETPVAPKPAPAPTKLPVKPAPKPLTTKIAPKPLLPVRRLT